MASDSVNYLQNPHDKNSPFVLIQFLNTIKLNSTNYLNWKLQITATLEGYDLLKFPDGSFPCPAATITTGTPPQTQPNPDNLTWKRQDKLIYGALLGTFSSSVCSLVTQTTTSHELWELLKQTFAKASRGHIKQLKDKLRTAEKGVQTVTDYLQSIKVTSDLLASLGAPVNSEDITDYVLRGLDATYKLVINGVNARDALIPYREWEKLLFIIHQLNNLNTDVA